MPDLPFDSGLPPMFLTADELVTLTGRKRASRQIEEITAINIYFLGDRLRNPVLAYVGGEGPRETKAKPGRKWEPGLG